jgi:hypothetical protein
MWRKIRKTNLLRLNNVKKLRKKEPEDCSLVSVAGKKRYLPGRSRSTGCRIGTIVS